MFDERQKQLVSEADKSRLAKQLTTRGFGPGADGVLYLGPSESSDLQMRIFNVDGSEAETCGNGLRCCAYFHHGLENPGESEFEIELPLASPVKARVSLDQPPTARVELELNDGGEYRGKRQVRVKNLELTYHYVDVGNPHAVLYLSENPGLEADLETAPVRALGGELQTHPDFADTNGINVEFVQPGADNSFNMRVFERGVGETSSCGTGSIAVARTSAKLELATPGWVTVTQPGGSLKIETKDALLKGPATYAYEGILAPNYLDNNL